MSGAAPGRLLDGIDVLLLDLDGVLWRGGDAIPNAVRAVTEARSAGTVLRYVTNNASRTPSEVADRLGDFGIPSEPGTVLTSATAAAGVLAEELAGGSRVLVCGAPALAEAVAGRGLVVVDGAGDDPAAVVSGWSDGLTYDRFAEAALAVRGGAWWVATNTDATLPSERGPLPGAGALVALVATAAGVAGPARVAGKPSARMHAQAVRETGAVRPWAVGDRLETDIVAARAAGVPALAVLSGVTTLRTLLAAPAEHRPDDVGVDLGVLLDPAPVRSGAEDGAVVGGWRARRHPDASGVVQLTAEAAPGTPSDAVRALLEAWPACGRPPERVVLQGPAEALRASVPGLDALVGR